MKTLCETCIYNCKKTIKKDKFPFFSGERKVVDQCAAQHSKVVPKSVKKCKYYIQQF